MPATPAGHFKISEFVQNSLWEDIGPKDVTTDSIVLEDSFSTGMVRFKEDAVLSGSKIFLAVFQELDPGAQWTTEYRDGDKISKGTELGKVVCDTAALLSGERTALNILQRMCGIATLTARYVGQVSDTKVRIIDTRKTVPGLRSLDKYAVSCGGGHNHRFGLYDGILIKDNHIIAAGSIKTAVDRVRQNAPHLLRVEVETSTMQQVEEALQAGAETILLDNMSVEEVKACVAKINGQAKVEVSGGVHLKNVKDYALAGPDFISVGALTHSPPATDISMDIDSHYV